MNGDQWKRKMSLRVGGVATLSLARPVIVGVLNMTPDSFSDGGKYVDEDAAVRHGVKMAREGAGVIDVGGESTRPGAEDVPPEVQKQRTLGVIRRLRKETKAVVSIDTRSAKVATAAVEAGATMINDVSAGSDPRMFEMAAACGAAMVLMHMQGDPRTMQKEPKYGDVVMEVRDYLVGRVEAAMRDGVKMEQIAIDPGIGFGKTVEHNLVLLANLDQLVATGFPVMLGTSRKSFLGSLLAGPAGPRPPAEELDAATSATTAIAVAAGVRLLRVHNVAMNRQAAETAYAIIGRSGR